MAVLWGLACATLNAALFAWTVVRTLWFGGPALSRSVSWNLLFVAARFLIDFLVGFIAGALFSVMLATAERRRTVMALSRARVALWGALAAGMLGSIVAYLIIAMIRRQASMMAMPIPPWSEMTYALSEITVFAVIGAVGAATTVSIAQRSAAPTVRAGASHPAIGNQGSGTVP